MIGENAAIPKGFQILIPELPVRQTVNEGEARVAADLMQEFPAGFPAARVDQNKAPVTVQRQRDYQRSHGARFVDMADGFPRDQLSPDLEMAIVDFDGRPGDQVNENKREDRKSESKA